MLGGDSSNVVHARLEQTDFPIGRLNDCLAEGKRHGNDPIGQIPLAVLDAGRDDGRIEPAAVTGPLTLHHGISLQRNRDLVETTRCFLGVADQVIKEPLGGAHHDYDLVAQTLKAAIIDQLDQLTKLSPTQIKKDRLTAAYSVHTSSIWLRAVEKIRTWVSANREDFYAPKLL